MIVRVHSLGSLWQTKDLPNGGTRVWNTTGIRDGCRVRSCATLFGQLVFGPKAKSFLRDPSRIHGRNWVTGDITQTSAGRSIRLACPAASGAMADWPRVGESSCGIPASRYTKILFARQRSWLSGVDSSTESPTSQVAASRAISTERAGARK